MTLELRDGVSLQPFNTFGIDARARILATVRGDDDLAELVASPAWRAMPRLVLGGGSNVLFTRDFDGLVVRLATRGISSPGVDDSSRVVTAAAGEPWDPFVRECLARGWTGLENLVLIPGTVGAAPVQNVGAYGVELAERFGWLETFDVDDGATRTMTAADCGFGYRDSVFKGALRGRRIITRVTFRLPLDWTPVTGYGDVAARLAGRDVTAAAVANVVAAIRREKLPDPAALGNAGSFFKNPVVDAACVDRIRAVAPDVVVHPQPDGRFKLPAGWLVDRCGWRGASLPGGSGRAAVHERQALVLVNRGGATGAEVLALADAIRDGVAERFGVVLEPEPLVV